MKISLLAAFGMAPILAFGSAAQSQEALRSSGPYIELGRTAESVSMVSGLPSATPTAPVDYWEWHFLPESRTVAGVTFDTLVFRRRVDCSARTLEALHSEMYLGAAFAIRAGGAAVMPVVAGSFGEKAWTIVCKPSSRTDKIRHADRKAARLAADLTFMDEE